MSRRETPAQLVEAAMALGPRTATAEEARQRKFLRAPGVAARLRAVEEPRFAQRLARRDGAPARAGSPQQ